MQPFGATLRAATLIGHLVDGRQCGGCTICCRVFDIPEVSKPADVLCRHCDGAGCMVYQTRPDRCRGYFCLWRRIEAMPDLARPDRLGIAFSIAANAAPPTPFEKLYIVARAADDAAAFETPFGRAALGMFIKEGSLPVFVEFQDERKMIFPDPAFREAILDPFNVEHASLKDAALEWRKSYGMSDTQPSPIQQGNAAIRP